MKRFEDSPVWQKSKILSLGIYKAFSDSKDFGFRDQIQRASVSVMNNVAEGLERSSEKELRKFLYIAKGSAGEVRSMLVLAQGLGYLSQEECEKLCQQAEEVSKLLAGFIRKL